jgi:hypothetical protein
MYEFLDFLAASHRTESGRFGSALIWDEYPTNPAIGGQKSNPPTAPQNVGFKRAAAFKRSMSLHGSCVRIRRKIAGETEGNGTPVKFRRLHAHVEKGIFSAFRNTSGG